MKPSICRMVIYRDRNGSDMPAVITGVIDADRGDVHLTCFPPPQLPPPALSYEFGTPQHREGPPLIDTWRWPERVS